ncbi:MAG: hypothetical protein ACKOXZ_08945, partial [Polynucleobacter victoriensis]
GASNDLKSSSDLARRLVTKYGMSDLGPVTFGKTEELFMGREVGVEKNYSERVASDIDDQVHKFVAHAYEIAEKILKSHKSALKKIADSKSAFVSRGDKSGTHAAELRYWKGAGVEVSATQPWYKETGSGMG